MENKGDILAVDDTPSSLKLLTDTLKAEGYQVRSAISGELALHAATTSPPELVLLDINMPGMNGYEVCQRLKAQPETSDTPIIFVSALWETVEKVKGFELGGVDYITKPYQREELLARVRTHLELYRLHHNLQQLVEERTNALRASEKKVRASLLDSIAAIAAAVEMRDPYTAGHQRRVALLAAAIARELQLPEDQIEGLYLAGVVHDVGKIMIPAEILYKPGKLSKLELSLIQGHVRSGHDVLKAIDFPWPIAATVFQHHERLDGSGYPQGLKSDEILLEAQILAVADVIEAMMADRPYRAGLGVEAALNEITSKRGTAYNSEVVDTCVKLFREERIPTLDQNFMSR
jgi:putative two-component system response regulator